HARRTAVIRGDSVDGGVVLYLSAVLLDARDQRVRERARAADRHADAVSLEEADEHERAEARGLLVRRHEVLARDAREVHADLVVLEEIAEEIVRAHLHVAPELAALAALVHERV